MFVFFSASQDPNWYRAKNSDGKEGMIPANYVQKRGEVKLNAMPYVFVTFGLLSNRFCVIVSKTCFA